MPPRKNPGSAMAEASDSTNNSGRSSGHDLTLVSHFGGRRERRNVIPALSEAADDAGSRGGSLPDGFGPGALARGAISARRFFLGSAEGAASHHAWNLLADPESNLCVLDNPLGRSGPVY